MQILSSNRAEERHSPSSTIKVVAILFGLLTSSAAYAEGWKVIGLPPEFDDTVSLGPYIDIGDAANSLVHFLENEGYVLAVVTAGDDILTVDLGRVDSVAVVGLDDKTAALARSYLEGLIGAAPQIDTVDHVAGLVNDIPGLDASLHFNRLGDANTYEAVLVGTQIAQSGSISIHNTPTEGLSGREAVLHQEFYSLATGGDILRFELAGAQEESESLSYFGEISYQAPINSIGTFAEGRLSYFDSASDFNFRNQNSLDTVSKAGALLLGHGFKRTVNEAQTGYIELDYRVDDDSLSDARENGVVRASWFFKRDTDQGDTLSYGLTLSGGQAFSGTEDSFGSLRGGMGLIYWLPSLSENAEILIEVSGQVGSDDQPAFELFSFGGQDKQRGFAPFEYAGSSGANVTLEIGETIHTDAAYLVGIAPYAFLDLTYLDNPEDEVTSGRPNNTELASSGIGVRTTFENGFSINSWVATPLHDGEQSNRSYGPEFYLQAQYSW